MPYYLCPTKTRKRIQSQLKFEIMVNEKFEIGQEVVRSKGDYVVGYTGTVIALDLEKGRAQVDWVETVKTWVSFNALALKSTPYEIVRREPKMVKGYKKYFHPTYRRI